MQKRKKKCCLLFSCAHLTLVSLSLWFIVFVEGELQSALNSTFYASVTCMHAKTEQLSTRPILSYRMLKMEFSVSLLKYMFDVIMKRKLLSFSKNGMFQHLWSQAVRSVWEFENGLRHFTAWRKWEIPFISIFKNQIQTHHHCKSVLFLHSRKENSDSSRIPMFARTRHRSELFRPLGLCTPSCLPRVSLAGI